MARIYWLLGSATDREAEAAIALSHELPESWSIICNKMLWTPYARRFELDMVIVGEHGVYVIDEKSWRSPVKCGTEWWTIANGQSIKSPLNKVENAAAVLGTSLRNELTGLRSVVRDGMLVHAFVLFSRPGIELDLNQCPTPDRILRMEQAAALLKSFDAYRGVKGRDLTPFSDGIVRWLLGSEEVMSMPVGLNERDGPSESRRRWRWLAAVAALVVIAVVSAVLLSSRGGEAAKDAVGATSPSPAAIDWQDAHSHVGELVVVTGPVMDVERSPMNSDPASTFINIGKEFHSGQAPDPGRFYAVVPEEYERAFRAKVSDLPGSPLSPAGAYGDHVVRVTGRIEENSRGEPFIEVHSTKAIARVD